MTHTIDTLMAQVDKCIATYAFHGTSDYMIVDDGKARADLHAALTEALQVAQPVPPHECKTEAEKLAYAAGWWKALEVNRAQPVRDTANMPLLALREARTRLEWFVDSYPHDITVSKATFFAGMDEAIATFSQPVRTKLPNALSRDDTEHGVYYYKASEVDAILAAQPVRKPLSRQQLIELSNLPDCMFGEYLQVFPFARAIEAAHGIKGSA